MNNNNQKTCKLCNETKDSSCFDHNRRKCKDCRAVINKNKYQNNKAYWKARYSYVPNGRPRGKPKKPENEKKIKVYVPTGRPRGRPKKVQIMTENEDFTNDENN